MRGQRIPTRHPLITAREALEGFARDQSEAGPYLPDAAIRLTDKAGVKELAGIIKYCAKNKIPVTPQGGLTGMTGGALPEKGGLVLSCLEMTGIKVDEKKRIAIVRPGAVISDVHRAAEAAGLFYPPDPTSLAGCTLGGNVATNAGGPRAAKYGVTRNYVADLEVILPTGEMIRTGRRTVKNTAGYDLTGLMVGSEGTLGFINEIVLRLLPAPEKVQTLLAFFGSVGDAMVCVEESRRRGLRPRALEFMDQKSLEVADRPEGRVRPAKGVRAALLIEEDGWAGQVETAVGRWTEVLEASKCQSVLASTSVKDQTDYWELRRRVSPAFKERGYKLSTDFAVPVDNLSALVSFIYGESQRRRLEEAGILIGVYGHAADGNLHVNLVIPDRQNALLLRLARAFEADLHKRALALDGTVAAEHGVGRTKRGFLKWQQSPALRAAQLQIKKALDPAGIFNPGKIHPAG